MVKTLTERQQHILFSTVEQYILSAEPVGSKRLVDKYNLTYSPATVRNELAELENLGFLYHPYTSSGRVPTDIGYRFYVNSLMNKISLTNRDEHMVGKFFAELNTELEDLMAKTSIFLSKLTNQFSLVFAPPIRRNRLKHIDLIKLLEHRFLIVLVTDTGLVKKQQFDYQEKISNKDLLRAESIVNDFLNGLHLDQILNTEIKHPKRTPPDFIKFVKKIKAEIADLLEQEDEGNYYLGQTSNVYVHPEYEDNQKVQELLNSLEKSYTFLRTLREEFKAKRVTIKIGQENRPQMLQEYSLIGTGFWIDDDIYGSLGIVGPTRMDYMHSVSIIEKIAEHLSKIVKSLSS